MYQISTDIQVAYQKQSLGVLLRIPDRELQLCDTYFVKFWIFYQNKLLYKIRDFDAGFHWWWSYSCCNSHWVENASSILYHSKWSEFWWKALRSLVMKWRVNFWSCKWKPLTEPIISSCRHLTLKLPRIWLLILPTSCYTFPCVIAARI